MRFQTTLLPGLAATASATNLYVSSYAGTVTSLSLTGGNGSAYSLRTTSTIGGCGVDPSWLTLDSSTGFLYCSDESINERQSRLATYSTSDSGKLSQIATAGTIYGPVSSVIYNDGAAIAQAHYLGSSVTTYTLQKGIPTSLQNFTFKLTAPGTNPSRQDAPHPHEVVLDPTGKYIVSPDLGADLVRVFSIDKATSELKEGTALKVALGSGPRHATFYKHANATYMYLISELGNTVTTFAVSYSSTGLSFRQLALTGVLGNATVAAGAAAAEILLTPDAKFVLTSVRNDSLITIDNFNPANSTKIQSDTLQSWSVDGTSGALTFQQLAAAGGSFPRQFSINKSGSLVAVGLQNDGTVVVIERDVASGKLGKIVAGVEVGGGITAVVWDE